jgi:hypothetical protein
MPEFFSFDYREWKQILRYISPKKAINSQKRPASESS